MPQPLFSLLMTAGRTTFVNQTDFAGAGAKNYIRLGNLRFVTRIGLWIADYSENAQTFLEFWLDAEDATKDPLWSFPVYPADLGASLARDKNPINDLSLFQPIESNQLDLQFRQGGAYPSGTIFKPATFSIWVEHYPFVINSGSA